MLAARNYYYFDTATNTNIAAARLVARFAHLIVGYFGLFGQRVFPLCCFILIIPETLIARTTANLALLWDN